MATTIDTIYTIWLREIKRFLKSKSRILGTGGQPLIWLAIVGVGFGSAIGVLAGGVSYITFMAPGIIGMTILFSSIFAGINVIYDKQFGFMKEILVAPVSRVGIVLGKIAGSATVSLISAITVLVIVILVGIIPVSSLTVAGLIEAVVFMVLTAAIFVSVGLVIATSINNMEGFQVIINFFILPLFFLSGALFPLTDAPLWMKAVSAVDPLRYGVDGMRGALIGTAAASYPLALDFVIILGVAVVLIAVADFAFRRMQAK
ncbi:MAG: ABC transporter permease [Candidatus Micrarchaeaceae archaeon]|jgi:ABC-2 type transport system permease protein|nr:ABC transporter permease [Candidatus Micrarchaeota archaeon]HII09876.1 ABC transporter permease [Candidatus Micrarchaeota archaeon]